MSSKPIRTEPVRWAPSSSRNAQRIVHRIFRDYRDGISVCLWDGQTVCLGANPGKITLIFRDPSKFREVMLFRDPLRLAEAHLSGHVDIEGSIYDALQLKEHFQSLRLSAREKLAILARALGIRAKVSPGGGNAAPSWRARPSGRHSRQSDRKAIAFHYDLSNDFYSLWLDRQMVYSCAYFETPEDSLDQAQCQKFDHLCRKLRLKAGETLLDIGCGWGGLVRWAARHYGVKALGITLSRNQFEHARRKVKEEGLAGQVEVELRDYRDLPPDAGFDKIVSVGMFEHVGIRNLQLYFKTAYRLLKPGGLFLNHGITSDSEGWNRSVANEFINRYVFPEGELETVSNVQRDMEACGFEILDVESLRPHYALTLRNWVRRLETCRQQAVSQVGEATYRIWRLYMAASALQFEAGELNIYQILTARRGKGAWPLPLTRRDLYPPRP